MREIKFRAKIKNTGEWFYFDLKTSDTNFAEIDWNTISQYTGLNDKNGKEIYEGDIVRSHEKVTTIIWLENEGGFYARTLTGECFKYAHNSIIEVIGNIYENSELLQTNESTSQ